MYDITVNPVRLSFSDEFLPEAVKRINMLIGALEKIAPEAADVINGTRVTKGGNGIFKRTKDEIKAIIEKHKVNEPWMQIFLSASAYSVTIEGKINSPISNNEYGQTVEYVHINAYIAENQDGVWKNSFDPENMHEKMDVERIKADVKEAEELENQMRKLEDRHKTIYFRLMLITR